MPNNGYNAAGNLAVRNNSPTFNKIIAPSDCFAMAAPGRF